MEKESYTAFYASRPFWAASKVDFTVPRVEGWFNRQMAEVVYNKSTPEFSLKICRDGQVLLRVNRLERPSGIEPSSPIGDIVRRWGEYLDYLNCFYLFLDSSSIEIDRRAYFNLHEITYRDAFRITFEDGKEVSQSIPAESIASVFQMGRYLSTYRADLPIEYDTRLFHRQIISLEAISLAGEKLLAVVSSAGAEKHFASYAKSLSEYKVGNYQTAIVLAWFILESIINDLWRSHLESLNGDLPGGRRRINRERRDWLTGRDFTASIVTNLLELFGRIESDTFEAADKVRGYRNKIAHTDNFSPGAEEAKQALEVAKEMITRKWRIEFTPNLSYSVQGI